MKWIWTKNKKAKYNLEKFRMGITVHENSDRTGTLCNVKGWYNKEDYEYLGEFDSLEDAQAYVDEITCGAL